MAQRATITTRPHIQGLRAPNWILASIPHASIPPDNPLFRLEARHVPTADQLQNKTLRRMVAVVVGSVMIWLLAVLVMLVDGSNRIQVYRLMGRAITLLFWGSLADKFVFDFIGIGAGLTLIRDEINRKRWDLLNLTPMRTEHIVSAKHAIAEIKAWNALILVMGVRLAVVILGVLHFGVLPILLDIGFGSPFFMVDLNYILRDFDSLVFVGGALVSVLIAGFVYVVEPRWRLRALAAAGILYSTQKRDVSLSIVSGFGGFIQVWMAQVFMAIGAILILMMVGTLFTLLWSVGGIIYVLMVGVFIHVTYRSLAERWLNRTWRQLLKRRGTI